MGRDDSPRARQRLRLARKQATRAGYDRILIVSEGSRTEPLYLREICAAYHLHSANVQVRPSEIGTAPIQVVRYAHQLFLEGDLHKGIRPRSFEQVFAVFDRDQHGSYFDALGLAESLDARLRNDEKQPVAFKAIASVPSFELWLLLHYEDVLAPLHRDEVMQRLKRHIPGYDKGSGGAFAITRAHLAIATGRAQRLAARFTAYDEPEPFTDMAALVDLLTKLRP